MNSPLASAHARAETWLDRLVTWMSGSFSSAQQASADPEYRQILLHMTPIWTDRTDGRWLYVEQAVAGTPDAPYRQRVYRLRAFNRSTQDPSLFTSDVYTLPGDPLAFAGAWKNPAKLAGLTPEQLTQKDGCSLILNEPSSTRPPAEQCFHGSTLGRDCPSDLRGAAYATSEAHIFADRLETWDRGFDTAGTQVWGATKGPYIFRRVTEP